MKHLTPLRAIRQHCLTCASRPKDVRECSTAECKLHIYRMGHNPARKKIGPSRVYARSILEGISSNLMTNSDEISIKRSYAMLKKIVQPGANNKEIRPIMEAVGRVRMLGKKIIIEW